MLSKYCLAHKATNLLKFRVHDLLFDYDFSVCFRQFRKNLVYDNPRVFSINSGSFRMLALTASGGGPNSRTNLNREGRLVRDTSNFDTSFADKITIQQFVRC